MPLMTLEYTNNLTNWKPSGFLTKAHQKMASDFGYDIHKIASRAYALDEYVLGDGSDGLALVMLSIEIGPHHSQEEREALRAWVIAELQTELKALSASLKIKLGCVVSDTVPNSYTWMVM